MALINTFSWKYCQLDVVVRRCSDSVSDHLGHVKVDICDLSRCTWKRSNGTACTVAYPPHLHGPVRISGNFVPDHFHPCLQHPEKKRKNKNQAVTDECACVRGGGGGWVGGGFTLCRPLPNFEPLARTWNSNRLNSWHTCCSTEPARAGGSTTGRGAAQARSGQEGEQWLTYWHGVLNFS